MSELDSFTRSRSYIKFLVKFLQIKRSVPSRVSKFQLAPIKVKQIIGSIMLMVELLRSWLSLSRLIV